MARQSSIESMSTPHALDREQSDRAYLDDSEAWTPTPFTAAPPPREGCEQRWVRIRMAGEIDVSNYLRQSQRGWKPRPADSIPAEYCVLKQRMDERFGEKGDVIGNQDSVLMERPIALGNRIRAYYSGQNNRLRASIAEFVGGRMPRTHGADGGRVDEFKLDVDYGAGRIPRIAPD